MDKDQRPEATSVEGAIRQRLRKKYGQLTRRSFLSAVTRKVFSLAGVGVAAQLLPYAAQEARAQSSMGALCGLHGFFCNASSPCSGGTPGAAWVQCCQIDVQAPPCPTVFTCCTYRDYCGTRPQGWPNGCAGTYVGGTNWCGTAPGDYLCTTINCALSYQNFQACQNNCYFYFSLPC